MFCYCGLKRNEAGPPLFVFVLTGTLLRKEMTQNNFNNLLSGMQHLQQLVLFMYLFIYLFPFENALKPLQRPEQKRS